MNKIETDSKDQNTVELLKDIGRFIAPLKSTRRPDFGLTLTISYQQMEYFEYPGVWEELNLPLLNASLTVNVMGVHVFDISGIRDSWRALLMDEPLEKMNPVKICIFCPGRDRRAVMHSKEYDHDGMPFRTHNFSNFRYLGPEYRKEMPVFWKR